MRMALPVVMVVMVFPVVAVAQPAVVCVRDFQPPSSERYYVTIFGGQGDLLRPRTAHTWATFVRTTTTPVGEQVVAEDTISWLPATLNVRPFALRAEKGVNLTLQQTFDFMGSQRRQRVVAWGPFEITADRYAQALAQKALLESGTIQYHSLGMLGRRADVMHCIDGVTRVDHHWEKESNPSWWFGEAGTAQATRAAVKCGFVHQPNVTCSEVLQQMNRTGYRLVVREYGVSPLFGLRR